MGVRKFESAMVEEESLGLTLKQMKDLRSEIERASDRFYSKNELDKDGNRTNIPRVRRSACDYYTGEYYV